MKEKLIPGQVVYARSDVFWWSQATIIGIDTTKTIVPEDTVVMITQVFWENDTPQYIYLTVDGMIADINDDSLRLDRPFDFWE